MTAATAQENQLLRRFRDKVPYRVECGNCGEEFFRKEFEENMKELNALKDADSVGELTLITCPECGETIDIMESGRK